MRATRYAKGLNKGIFWLTSLALLLALALPGNGTGVVQASPGPDIVTLRPDGPGDETDLTPNTGDNYAAVDEDPSNDDITYVYAKNAANYLTDLYSLADTSLIGKINSVTVHINCKALVTPVQASARTRIKTNGSAWDGAEILLTTSYNTTYTTYTTNPTTGQAWTRGEVNALQAGVALKQPTTTGGSRESRCTQVYVVVDYTPFSTAISIVGKVADDAVGSITFPAGAPGATVSAPYNDVDGDEDPQVVAGSDSEPVVRLKNTLDGTLKVWLEITTWSNGVVASEDYELVATGTTTVEVVDDVLSADGNAASVNTGVTIAAAAYKALYLELVLSSLAGKSGTSTLTILGEST